MMRASLLRRLGEQDEQAARAALVGLGRALKRVEEAGQRELRAEREERDAIVDDSREGLSAGEADRLMEKIASLAGFTSLDPLDRQLLRHAVKIAQREREPSVPLHEHHDALRSIAKALGDGDPTLSVVSKISRMMEGKS
jgi:hypothetical protein